MAINENFYSYNYKMTEDNMFSKGFQIMIYIEGGEEIDFFSKKQQIKQI